MVKKSFYLLIVVLIIVLAAGACYLTAGSLSAGASNNAREIQFGYVDMDQLMKEVSGIDELQKLDEQLNKLKAELDEYQNGNTKLETEKYQLLAKKKEQYTLQLKAEYELQKQKIDSMVKDLSAQLETNNKTYHAELEKLTQQIMSNGLPDVLGSSFPKNKNLKQQLQEFARDLLYLKDRQIAAKRLEMGKKVSQDLQVHKNELNQQLADYETELLKQNQNEKVNLTLKMQVAKTETEYQEVQAAMKQLEVKENEAKEAKKAELEKQFNQYRETIIKQQTETFNRFKQKLDQEVNRQLLTQQQTLLRSNGIGETKLNQLISQHPLIKAKKQEFEKSYKQQQAQLEVKLKTAQKQMTDYMKSREKYFMSQLQEEENKLNQQLLLKQQSEEKTNLQEKTAKTKTYDSLLSQRKQLYLQITNKIRKVVRLVAKENKIQVVLAMVDINVKAKNITDQCVEKLKEIKK